MVRFVTETANKFIYIYVVIALSSFSKGSVPFVALKEINQSLDLNNCAILFTFVVI